jgi:selenocysteine lyase/cysteine desulfurase
MTKSTSHSAWDELGDSLYQALRTYSNVHRGTGHYSQISTALYEKAREIVLESLHLDPTTHTVVFGTPRRARLLSQRLEPGSYRVISSQELGLPLGIRALAVPRNQLPKGIPPETGGGAVKLVSTGSVVWADAPERYEAGTPAILNAIALAKALHMAQKGGKDIFQGREAIPLAETQTKADLDELVGDQLYEALCQRLIGADVPVPTSAGQRPYVNLDHGASTPTFVPIWEAAWHACGQPPTGQKAIVEETRQTCAALLDAPSDQYEILFCANTTEAINIAAKNLALQATSSSVPLMALTTRVEHHSNDLPWREVPSLELGYINVDNDGLVDLGHLEALLARHNGPEQADQGRVILVAVSGASNVLGTFNDLSAISRLVHRYGAHLLIDGAQLVAHRPLSMRETGIDFFAFSGHKAYAPFGSGALVARREQLYFSPAQWAYLSQSGEENILGIAALGKALELLGRLGLEVVQARETELSTYTLQGLRRIPQIQFFGPEANRGGVISFSMRNVPHNLVAKELAERGGIGVRNGCFCAHPISKRLMGIAPWRERAGELGLWLFPALTARVLPGLVRISLGLENTKAEIDHTLDILRDIAQTPRSPLIRLIAKTYNGAPWPRRTTVSRQIEHMTHDVCRAVYDVQ